MIPFGLSPIHRQRVSYGRRIQQEASIQSGVFRRFAPGSENQLHLAQWWSPPNSQSPQHCGSFLAGNRALARSEHLQQRKGQRGLPSHAVSRKESQAMRINDRRNEHPPEDPRSGEDLDDIDPFWAGLGIVAIVIIGLIWFYA